MPVLRPDAKVGPGAEELLAGTETALTEVKVTATIATPIPRQWGQAPLFMGPSRRV